MVKNNQNSTRLQELGNQIINEQESINNLILELENELEPNTCIKSELQGVVIKILDEEECLKHI